MSKYINADKLCEDLMTRWEIADKEKEKEIQSIMANIVTPIVVGQPSADVVEVVRCKDCVYGIENGELCGRKVYLCSALTNPNEFYGDYYCADGERKETE